MDDYIVNRMERIGPIEQATDGLASPPVALHGHTTTPADSSPRLLSSAGSSAAAAAAAAADYDFSFHDLMDAELMSVNELENLWATSNPADEQGDTHAAVAAAAAAAAASASAAARVLAPIPERADEDGEAAPSRLAQQPVCAPRATDSAAAVDSVEPTAALVDSTSDHFAAGEAACGSKVVLPDPFGDIAASAMVATTVAVSPRVVLTIVETVPVYMTVVTTTEPAGGQGKWLVRRHRLLRLVENGYVNASSLLLAGGVASEQERSIVLSLEVGRFKWRRPQSKLYGTWIPLPRARALAATCSLNHRLGPFLNDNLEDYFPAPLPTSFVRHVITPFFADAAPAEQARETGLGIEFQSLVNSVAAHQSISRSSTFGATARGTPSPSIIQALSRPPPLGVAAAKAILASDDRHLQALLQLLSADGPMLGASEAAMAAVAAAVAAAGDGALPQPPPSPAGDGTKGGEREGPEGSERERAGREGSERGPVDALRLSAAIAETIAEPAADDLELLGMGVAAHDADLICSSTPPSPPPPPPSPPRLRRASTTDGADAGRRAAGLNARLAQTMEAFGLSGAARASLLLRLRAAAAASTTGRPQAVAPYLLLRSAKRPAEAAAGARKRARVVR
ncbi:hypothetical protein GGI18_002481, partial [Coemansia linderi]